MSTTALSNIYSADSIAMHWVVLLLFHHYVLRDATLCRVLPVKDP